jgi:hypothetical protein
MVGAMHGLLMRRADALAGCTEGAALGKQMLQVIGRQRVVPGDARRVDGNAEELGPFACSPSRLRGRAQFFDGHVREFVHAHAEDKADRELGGCLRSASRPLYSRWPRAFGKRASLAAKANPPPMCVLSSGHWLPGADYSCVAKTRFQWGDTRRAINLQPPREKQGLEKTPITNLINPPGSCG